MTKRKICVVAGTRAECGLLYWLMPDLFLQNSPSFELSDEEEEILKSKFSTNILNNIDGKVNEHDETKRIGFVQYG